eukprot:TRINITY_DN2469_c0_g2_i7.p1 TRINITY_DN2469_c0_g2~~TRINITY_DN2469_c0_g2_i7.p1  ORF type:complete len:466 (+),score=32.56 TRINITY_DN2469_c0_g2_i7:44-1441(+)
MYGSNFSSCQKSYLTSRIQKEKSKVIKTGGSDRSTCSMVFSSSYSKTKTKAPKSKRVLQAKKTSQKTQNNISQNNNSLDLTNNNHNNNGSDASMVVPKTDLHQEILEYSRIVEMNDKEKNTRIQIIKRIHDAISQLFGWQVEVQPYGSFNTELSLFGSDVDIAIFNFIQFDNPTQNGFTQKKRQEVISCLNQLRSELLSEFPGRIQISRPIPARVPILGAKINDVYFDISIGDDSALTRDKSIASYSKAFPQFRPLALTLKSALKQVGLLDYSSGGLSSYSVYQLLIAHLLLCQKERVINMEDLGEIFQDFGRRYSNTSLLTTKSICITSTDILQQMDETIKNGANKGHPCLVGSPSEKKQLRFCIEDPYSGMDIAAQTNKIDSILSLFKKIYKCQLNVVQNPKNLQFPLLFNLWDAESAKSRLNYRRQMANGTLRQNGHGLRQNGNAAQQRQTGGRDTGRRRKY